MTRKYLRMHKFQLKGDFSINRAKTIELVVLYRCRLSLKHLTLSRFAPTQLLTVSECHFSGTFVFNCKSSLGSGALNFSIFPIIIVSHIIFYCHSKYIKLRTVYTYSTESHKSMIITALDLCSYQFYRL